MKKVERIYGLRKNRLNGLLFVNRLTEAHITVTKEGKSKLKVIIETNRDGSVTLVSSLTKEKIGILDNYKPEFSDRSVYAFSLFLENINQDAIRPDGTIILSVDVYEQRLEGKGYDGIIFQWLPQWARKDSRSSIIIGYGSRKHSDAKSALNKLINR